MPLEQRQGFKWRDLNPFLQLSDLFVRPSIRGLLLAFLIFNFAFAGFTSIFVLFLDRRFNWGPSQAALVFVAIGVVSTVVQAGLIRKLLPLWGEVKLAIYGFILLVVGFGLIVVIPRQALLLNLILYTSVTLIAIGVGFVLPSIRGLISNLVSDQEQGKTIGSTQGLQSVAAILGPIWAGWTFDHLGIFTPFLDGCGANAASPGIHP
nr:MFS transporter [Neosynechococcus sphagnicola]